MSYDALFPRSFKASYPTAVRAEGVYLYDDQDRKYLDACGGAAVVTVGHAVKEVIGEIAALLARLPYVHSSQFTTQVAAELAGVLAARFPGPAQQARVHFTSGGSEATETAIKVARQYWISRGQPQRYKILSRWQSYHGTTLGALALSGNRRRRKPYEPMLPEMGHISACFCYRCPLGLTYPACELACARELEEAIQKAGPESVAGFIFEPVVGASSGAAPPDGYLQLIQDICRRHAILMIADEVMTGAGRTGRYFAVEHWGVVPDILLLAKGLSSGYAPLGAVLIAEHVWRAIEAGTGTLEHGFTYQCHPPAMAAGLAVQRYLEKHNLVERSRQRGEYFAQRLERLRALPGVGDVRGKGLLQTVEFVADRRTRAPFPTEMNFSGRFYDAMLARGVLTYPMRGTVDGAAGDHVLLAPPFVIEEAQLDFIVEQMEAALAELGAAGA
jgi:adenosylmethionine-8-amino-7-oxononanoate aminotransferase